MAGLGTSIPFSAIPHARDHDFEAFARSFRLSLPYCTRGVWEQVGLHGCNRLPFWRCFLTLAASPTPSWIRTGQQAEPLRLVAGKALLIPDDIDLEFHFSPGCELIAIHFQAECRPGQALFSDRQVQERTCPDWLAACDLRSARSLGLLGWWQALLAEFIDELPPPVAPFWQPLLAWAERDLAADIRLDHLGAVVGLSANALGKRFRRDFGCTCKEWLDRQLADAAAERLISSADPIKLIAEQFRFSTEFHFSRFFKRRMGLSPLAFRQQAQPWPLVF
jgi:AraC-like DNA-binding protein